MTRRPKATDARRVTRLALELMVLQSKLSGNPQDPNDKLPTTCQCDESASARHCSFCPDSPMALAPRTRRPSDSRTSRGNDFGDVGRLGRIHRLEPRQRRAPARSPQCPSRRGGDTRRLTGLVLDLDALLDLGGLRIGSESREGLRRPSPALGDPRGRRIAHSTSGASCQEPADQLELDAASGKTPTSASLGTSSISLIVYGSLGCSRTWSTGPTSTIWPSHKTTAV